MMIEMSVKLELFLILITLALLSLPTTLGVFAQDFPKPLEPPKILDQADQEQQNNTNPNYYYSMWFSEIEYYRLTSAVCEYPNAKDASCIAKVKIRSNCSIVFD
jgi:hypothetical protein